MSAQKFHGTLEGTLEARLSGKGSKSEKTAYHIVFDDDEYIEMNGKRLLERRLELAGENPFEQPTLKALVGKRVRASDGHWIDDLWRAASVEEVTPPRPKARKKRPRKR